MTGMSSKRFWNLRTHPNDLRHGLRQSSGEDSKGLNEAQTSCMHSEHYIDRDRSLNSCSLHIAKRGVRVNEIHHITVLDT